jgi:hypothetical protein
MNRFAFLLAVFLSACGGGGGDFERYLLTMQTAAAEAVVVGEYESVDGCTEYGSYLVVNSPGRYAGFTCKEV